MRYIVELQGYIFLSARTVDLLSDQAIAGTLALVGDLASIRLLYAYGCLYTVVIANFCGAGALPSGIGMNARPASRACLWPCVAGSLAINAAVPQLMNC